MSTPPTIIKQLKALPQRLKAVKYLRKIEAASHSPPDLAYLLVRLQAAEAVCEAAQLQDSDFIHHSNQRLTVRCDWCGGNWPCDVRQLADALAAWQQAKGFKKS